MVGRHPCNVTLPFLIATLLHCAGVASAIEVRPLSPERTDLRSPPLDRLVKMDLWGARLSDFVQEVKNQSGIEILLDSADFPTTTGASDLYLVSGQVPLRTALECLAKRFSFRYHVSASGRIEISKGYDWAAAEPALRFQRLDAIIPPSGVGIDELNKLLREFIKPLPLLNGEYGLTFEKSSLPNNPHSVRAVSVLPPTLADYLEKGVFCLSGDAGDFPPSAGDSQRLFAYGRNDPTDWEKMFSRQIAMPRGRDLHAILNEICGQAGFAIALAGPPTDSANLTGVASETIGLGRVTEELSKRFNLGKRVFLASGSLVFEAGSGGEWETDNRGRELYWGGLAVAGFDARSIVSRMGGGDNFLNYARSNVFPNLWRDPACSLVYSDITGRVAVIAPVNAVEAFAAWLKAIHQ